MGKATRWLRGLLGMKKDKENMGNSSYGARREKKKWSFGKPDNNSGQFPANDAARLRPYISETEKEQNKHAIAVAAATAAAADAAVAAAQAAVAVLRLTSQGRGNLFRSGRESWAALKIQTAFRGYLSRKALRALKGLVKLQALVRGYLVRKQATATLHCMEALIRAQTAVRSRRAFRSFNKDRQFQHKNSMGRFDETKCEFHSKRISSSCNSTINGSDDSSKIVEIDTYKPTTINHSLSIPNCRHPRDSEWCLVGDEHNFFTAQSTPRFTNSGRFNAPVSPAKSVSGDSFFRPYSNFPSYMADTQSFRAKLRSHSAPKQRPEAAPKRRVLLNEIMASRSSLSGVRMQRSCSQGFDL